MNFIKKYRHHHALLTLILFLTVTAVSFAVKTWHFNHEASEVAGQIGDTSPVKYHSIRDFLPEDRPNFIPFTIESAMMFAYASDIAEGKKVPARDPRLAYLPDVPPYAQMNMALEWALGWSWRIRNALLPAPDNPTAAERRFQDNPAFARWVSLQIRIWTALISGFIFLWLAALRTPLRFAFAGGLLHAVAAASIARATGQDIVRGDFCIPLILASFVLAYSFAAAPKRWKLLLLFLGTALAFAAWDLCQLIFNAWAMVEMIRVLFGGICNRKRIAVWLVITLAVVFNALFIPFNQTYGLLQSPLVCVVLPLLLLTMLCSAEKASFFRTFPRRAAVFCLLLAILWPLWHVVIDTPQRRSSYSHFTAAMKAKWEFNNVKPQDPAKLNYDARIMWTPSMHSADWKTCSAFFPSPGSLPGFRMTGGPTALRNFWNYAPFTISILLALLFLGGLFTPVRRSLLRDLPRSLLPYLFSFGFAVGFVYIVRYHEFLIIFLSVLFGLVLHRISHAGRGKRKFWKYLVRGAVALVLCVEIYASVFGRIRVYSEDVYLKETAMLIEWLREADVRKKTIVANFTTGPMFMAYCGMNLVLQPQFGLEAIRKPVEEYLTLLYHGNEAEMSGFCLRYGSDYFLYDHGTVGSLHPYSTRYIANAVDLSMDSPAFLMQYKPDSLKWFYRIVPPAKFGALSRKYSLFKVIRPNEKSKSIRLTSEGETFLKNGNRELAAKRAKDALELDPTSDRARLLYFKTWKKIPRMTLHGLE